MPQADGSEDGSFRSQRCARHGMAAARYAGGAKHRYGWMGQGVAERLFETYPRIALTDEYIDCEDPDDVEEKKSFSVSLKRLTAKPAPKVPAGYECSQRQFVIDELLSSETRVLKSLDGLNASPMELPGIARKMVDCRERQTPGRVRTFHTGSVENALQKPPEPDKQAQRLARAQRNNFWS